VTKLLERDRELAAIEAALAADAGHLLVIEGPAGLGKTSLLAEARRRAAAGGMLALAARGAELERDHPFGVVLQLLERPLLAAPPERRRELLAGSAGLAAPLLLGTGVRAGGEQPLLHGLFWVVQNLAESQPALLVIDDAHWADPSSLRFLLYLAHRIEELAITIVLAARSGEPGAPSELASLARHGSARRLVLEHLSSAAVERLIQRSRPDADPAFAQACAAVTGGNPFLVIALVDTVLAGGAPADAAAARRVADSAPETVVGSVIARLERLGPAAAELARALSVLSDGSPLRRAARLAGPDLDAAGEAAGALAAASILRPDRLAFVHPLLRTAVHDTIPAHRRAALYGRAARLLHEEGAPLEQVAASLLHSRAQADPWAIETLRTAAHRAAAEGASSSAATYLRRALEEPPSEPARAGVLFELGCAEALSGDEAGIERIRESLALVNDPRERARMSLRLAGLLHPLGRDVEAADALQRALDDLDGHESDVALELEAAWITVGRFELSLRHASTERLRTVAAGVAGNTPAERVLLALEADRGALAGEPRETVLDAAARAWAGGRLLEEQTAQSWAPMAALAAMGWSDDFDACEAGVRQVQADARRRGLVHAHASATYFLAFPHYYRGRLADAAADLHAAIDVRRLGWREHLPAACAQLACTLIDQGHLDEADRALSLPELQTLRENIGYALVIDAHARLALQRGRPAEALESLIAVGALVRSVGVHNPSCLPWRSLAALAAAQIGDREQAAELAREELELARRFGAPRPIGIALRVTGLLTGGDTGIEQLREAVATLEHSPAELELCRALVDYGAALRRAGHRRDARDPLRTGLDMAQRFDAALLEQRARDELVAAGARPRRRQFSGLDALTPSERRVARMAADGMTNRQIAETLFVTVKAVQWHLGNTYRKLSVSSRDELPAALRAEIAVLP
jgi:DNA-binding CsgD family transcriptional regulator